MRVMRRGTGLSQEAFIPPPDLKPYTISHPEGRSTLDASERKVSL